MIKFLLLLLVLIAPIDAKKKKHKKPKKQRPTDVSAKEYCAACSFLVEMTLGRLHGSMHEYDIVDAMDDACRISDEMARQPYLPPQDMVKSCEAFIGHWDEELQDFLLKRSSDDVVE